MADDRTPLAWKQRRTPKRGTRKARNWRRIYPGYVFPNTAWTVTQGPYKRIRRDKVKSWVTVRCGHCKQEFERRLDHLVAGKSRCCWHCAPHIHKPWVTRWEDRQGDDVDGASVLEIETEPTAVKEHGDRDRDSMGKGTSETDRAPGVRGSGAWPSQK